MAPTPSVALRASAGLQTLGDSAADLAMYQVQLGSVWRQRGELDQAYALQEQGLAAAEAKLKPTDVRLDAARVELALTLAMRGGPADGQRAQTLLGQVEPATKSVRTRSGPTSPPTGP